MITLFQINLCGREVSFNSFKFASDNSSSDNMHPFGLDLASCPLAIATVISRGHCEN